MPPLVGAIFLVVVYAVVSFDVFFLGYAGVPFSLSGTIKLFTNTLYTFYAYYLLAYLVFFLYLIIVEKINKLSVLVVMVSGFLYGLITLLFPVNQQDTVSILISLVIAVSGVICAACYYYLDKKFRRLFLAKR